MVQFFGPPCTYGVSVTALEATLSCKCWCESVVRWPWACWISVALWRVVLSRHLRFSAYRSLGLNSVRTAYGALRRRRTLQMLIIGMWRSQPKIRIRGCIFHAQNPSDADMDADLSRDQN